MLAGRYRDSAGGDCGSVSVSWVSLVVLAATVVVALTSAGLPGAVRDAAESALCPLKRDVSCETAAGRVQPVDAPGRDDGTSPPPAGAQDPAHPRDLKDRPVMRPFEGPIISREDYDEPWKCGWFQIGCDVAQGTGLGLVDMVKDGLEGLALVACSTYACGPDNFDDSWSTWKAIADDPWGSVKTGVEEATKEIVHDWQTGHEGRAVTRAIPSILGSIFGGKGVGKLRALGDGSDRGDPVQAQPRDGPDDPAAAPVAPDIPQSEARGALTNLGRYAGLRRWMRRASGGLNLDDYAPGSGFSGVYDPESGTFLARPSGGTVRRDGQRTFTVPRRGGHGMLSEQLRRATKGDPKKHVGFTILIGKDGALRVEWFSRGVNGRNPSFRGSHVPEHLRESILDAIRETTGRVVEGAP
ncbi:hypothetical protein SAMN04489712_105184 [Thermomonospora echinospora]|uniref:Uncharacterized protein n=2 Tax=Thermomonospora echinospora TaxID=1992 RepID=A0A1H6A574_9ACTN|nr:hypothetical protein SAMN04489712_105184 [Thermomonospora echinospora]